ncbi:hypothetical protein C2E20_8241 [Micractinium conductrix]|uniref:Uncharacterized protein n=1 Tax=Micractinium conductrix TaxID=554055 RepID=A0A2P6V234_9CHLO|nr:hypothetical protein C2E20_8241 [Micractinium conductrix]|eukprot:PSC68156.1 hypothetical protein C2E20_8241 [Micractinium conductrix]
MPDGAEDGVDVEPPMPDDPEVPMVPLAADQLVDAAAPAADQLAFTGACRRTGRRAAGLPTT